MSRHGHSLFINPTNESKRYRRQDGRVTTGNARQSMGARVRSDIEGEVVGRYG